MKEWKERYVHLLVKAAVLMQDLFFLRKNIEKEKDFPDVREILQAAYNIYSADPDIVSIYYNAQNRLRAGAYKSEAEHEALKVLFQIAEEVIQKAAKAAAKI